MYDVYGLGNALVDTEYRIDDDFLAHHAIAKGHMTLVEEDRMEMLIEANIVLTERLESLMDEGEEILSMTVSSIITAKKKNKK